MKKKGLLVTLGLILVAAIINDKKKDKKLIEINTDKEDMEDSITEE